MPDAVFVSLAGLVRQHSLSECQTWRVCSREYSKNHWAGRLQCGGGGIFRVKWRRRSELQNNQDQSSFCELVCSSCPVKWPSSVQIQFELQRFSFPFWLTLPQQGTRHGRTAKSILEVHVACARGYDFIPVLVPVSLSLLSMSSPLSPSVSLSFLLWAPLFHLAMSSDLPSLFPQGQ